MNTFLSRAECEVRSVVPAGIVMLRTVSVSRHNCELTSIFWLTACPQDLCPPLEFTGEEARCDKLRVRGTCQDKTERSQPLPNTCNIYYPSYFIGRYFYDKYSKRCVKFGGCTDLGNEENNFGFRKVCVETCKPK